jgi:hypothetical protein
MDPGSYLLPVSVRWKIFLGTSDYQKPAPAAQPSDFAQNAFWRLLKINLHC